MTTHQQEQGENAMSSSEQYRRLVGSVMHTRSILLKHLKGNDRWFDEEIGVQGYLNDFFYCAAELEELVEQDEDAYDIDLDEKVSLAVSELLGTWRLRPEIKVWLQNHPWPLSSFEDEIARIKEFSKPYALNSPTKRVI